MLSLISFAGNLTRFRYKTKSKVTFLRNPFAVWWEMNLFSNPEISQLHRNHLLTDSG